MTAAAEIRDAAQTIRDAADSLPHGDWVMYDGGGPYAGDGLMRARCIAQRGASYIDNGIVLGTSDGSGDIRGSRQAFEHVALWRRDTAEAVADWLDEAAAQTEALHDLAIRMGDDPDTYTPRHALAVARAVLRQEARADA